MNSRPRSGLAATRLPEGRRRPGQSAAVVAKAGNSGWRRRTRTIGVSWRWPCRRERDSRWGRGEQTALLRGVLALRIQSQLLFVHRCSYRFPF